MIILQNETLLVQVQPKGAELTRICGKLEQLDYLWKGDPAIWGKHSPVLFPIVGTLKDNQYIHNDEKYTLPRHGFARDRVFTVEKETAEEVTLELKSDEETLKVFPFQFRFQIIYKLELNTLSTTYRVINDGDETMYFSVGAHPAFAIPFRESESYSDYRLHFNKKENADRWPISPAGLIETKSVELLKDTDTLPLDKSLFQKDALVIKDLKSDTISICKDDKTHVRFHFPDFPYFGIWAAKDADFVCLEPWCGIADSTDASGVLKEKEGIISLEAGKEFSRTWSATFSQALDPMPELVASMLEA